MENKQVPKAMTADEQVGVSQPPIGIQPVSNKQGKQTKHNMDVTQ